jgi:hypothetical protein
MIVPTLTDRLADGYALGHCIKGIHRLLEDTP